MDGPETIDFVPGRFFWGDNLEVLREMPSEWVDLVYLDPPFNSQRTYNLVFRDQSSRAAEQAFCDVWRWDSAAEKAFRQLQDPGRSPEALREIISALHRFFGPGRRDDLAYPVMMAVRLLELHRVLKQTGSLYLHCDPTSSHHLRMVLDGIFGTENFRNELVWKRTSAHSSAKRFGPVHDTILFYSKSSAYTWNQQYTPHDPEYVRSHYRHDDGNGRLYRLSDLTAAGTRNGSSGMPWRGIDVTAKGNHWKFTIERLEELDREGRIYWPRRGSMPSYKRYLDEVKGRPLQDIIDDIAPIGAHSKERIGFPTQKPVELLERLLLSSSNEGDLVLDPFCGCGTTIEAAERLKRRWIGIDIAKAAVDIIRGRLEKSFPAASLDLVIVPADADSARALANSHKVDFERWAVRRLGGRHSRDRGFAPKRGGGDRGVDGEIFVEEPDAPGHAQRVVISVKGGAGLNPAMVREVIGTIASERAVQGILVTARPPTDGMKGAAREAGTLRSTLHAGEHIPRVQIVTVDDIFDGKLPKLAGFNVTHREAAAGQCQAPSSGWPGHREAREVAATGSAVRPIRAA
jgi:DNA modification methylase